MESILRLSARDWIVHIGIQYLENFKMMKVPSMALVTRVSCNLSEKNMLGTNGGLMKCVEEYYIIYINVIYIRF